MKENEEVAVNQLEKGVTCLLTINKITATNNVLYKQIIQYINQLINMLMRVFSRKRYS